MSNDHNTRKPHNYSEELTPTELEEWANMEAAAAEVRRIKEIGEAVNMFESFQRWLKTTDSDSKQEPTRPIPKVNPMPPWPRRLRRRIGEPGPLLEEVMLARGLLHAAKKRGD